MDIEIILNSELGEINKKYLTEENKSIKNKTILVPSKVLNSAIK